jgi:hypothetical protein
MDALTMPTCICWACGTERELGVSEQPVPLCSEQCREEFVETVNHLISGGTLDEIGVDHMSMLGRQAIDMVLHLRRADRIEEREWREWEYERNRRRKLKSLYPC